MWSLLFVFELIHVEFWLQLENGAKPCVVKVVNLKEGGSELDGPIQSRMKLIVNAEVPDSGVTLKCLHFRLQLPLWVVTGYID